MARESWRCSSSVTFAIRACPKRSSSTPAPKRRVVGSLCRGSLRRSSQPWVSRTRQAMRPNPIYKDFPAGQIGFSVFGCSPFKSRLFGCWLLGIGYWVLAVTEKNPRTKSCCRCEGGTATDNRLHIYKWPCCARVLRGPRYEPLSWAPFAPEFWRDCRLIGKA